MERSQGGYFMSESFSNPVFLAEIPVDDLHGNPGADQDQVSSIVDSGESSLGNDPIEAVAAMEDVPV